MNLKNILFMILGVLLPLAFTAIVNVYPDFPFAQSDFVEGVLWIIGLLIGGWNAAVAQITSSVNRNGVTNVGKMQLTETQNSMRERLKKTEY